MELTANATLSSPKLLWLPRQSNLSRKPDEHPHAHLLNQLWRFPCQQPLCVAEQVPANGRSLSLQPGRRGRKRPQPPRRLALLLAQASCLVILTPLCPLYPRDSTQHVRPAVGGSQEWDPFSNLPPGNRVGLSLVVLFFWCVFFWNRVYKDLISTN